MRRLVLFGACVVAAVTLAVVGPAVAGATPGYPPVPSGSGSGSCVVGGSVSGTATGFAANSTVSYPGGSGTANSAGDLPFTISCTTGHYSINGGNPQPDVYGDNTIDFTGTSPGNARYSYVYTLDVLATALSAITPTVAVSPPASSSLALTGADIGLMVGGGVLLIAIGTGLLVLANRRRSARS